MPRLRRAVAKTVRDGFAETFAYTEFPPGHRAGSGRTTGSSTSTARSGGGRGRRDLPERQLGRHAGVSEAEVHSEARMGQEEVPGHVQTGGDGRAEGKSGGLEEDGAEDG